MGTVRGLERDVEDLREYYRLGKTKEASWRKSQLKGLLTFLKEKDGDIFEALKQDLGKHQVEAFRDEVYIYMYVSCMNVFFEFSCLKITVTFFFRLYLYFKRTGMISFLLRFVLLDRYIMSAFIYTLKGCKTS
jgi:hypothetical protein